VSDFAWASRADGLADTSTARVGAAIHGDAVEVDRHLLERVHEDLDRVDALDAADVGVLAAEDLLREREHARLVGLGNAEDAQYDVQRIVERDVANEVALTVVVEHAVDEALGEHGELGADLAPQVRRLEPVVGDEAIGAMLGAVHVDERLDVDAEGAALLDLLTRQQHRVACVPEEQVVALDLGEVGVARDGAERDVTLDRDPRQRIVAAEAGRRGVPDIQVGVGSGIDEDARVAEGGEIRGSRRRSHVVP